MEIIIKQIYLRYMYDFKYIAIVDLDELLLPLKFDTMPEVIADMERSTNLGFDSLLVWGTFFFDSAVDEGYVD